MNYADATCKSMSSRMAIINLFCRVFLVLIKKKMYCLLKRNSLLKLHLCYLNKWNDTINHIGCDMLARKGVNVRCVGKQSQKLSVITEEVNQEWLAMLWPFFVSWYLYCTIQMFCYPSYQPAYHMQWSDLRRLGTHFLIIVRKLRIYQILTLTYIFQTISLLELSEPCLSALLKHVVSRMCWS